MTHHHRSPDPSPSPAVAAIVPAILGSLMATFRGFFTAPVWDHVLVLIAGAVLAPGKRTVSAALRIMGLSEACDFAVYHHVLSQARWDSRAIARKLLTMILDRFLPWGPLVVGIDDTIERRWGAKIAARGIYRDPVRSSHGHFVKASGLRWLSFMALVPLPWARRRWALPFLTVLAPSQRYEENKGRRHKALTDWARQGILQIKRWLPNRPIIIVADSSFSAIELITAVRRHVCFITRLRLDANLFAPAPKRHSRKIGRPPKKGLKLPKLTQMLSARTTAWTTIIMPEWYGGERCRLQKPSDRDRNRDLVPLGAPAGADPLGAGARPSGYPQATGLPVHRPRRNASRDPGILRPSLVDREHVSGNPRASRCRNPAAVVRSRHRANDAGALGPVLTHYSLGRRRQGRDRSPSKIGGLVRQGRIDLRRRHRHCPTRLVERTEFIDIPEKPRNRRNSDRLVAKTHGSALLRDLKCAKSS